MAFADDFVLPEILKSLLTQWQTAQEEFLESSSVEEGKGSNSRRYSIRRRLCLWLTFPFQHNVGRNLIMFTNLYPHRHALAGKPVCAFTTGAGGQVTALDNIDRILGAFNPRWIKPGFSSGGRAETKRHRTSRKTGEKLAQSRVIKIIIKRSRNHQFPHIFV